MYEYISYSRYVLTGMYEGFVCEKGEQEKG